TTAESGDLRRDSERPRRLRATTTQQGKDRPTAFPLALSQQERPNDRRGPRPAARRDTEMTPDRPGHRAGNDKTVPAAESIGSKRPAHDLERPSQAEPLRRRGKLAPHPLGEGTEMIFDMTPGQQLEPGAQR